MATRHRNVCVFGGCALLLALLAALLGCSSSSPAASETDRPDPSASLTVEETIIRFVVATANNDTETAESLCTDYCRGWGADLVIDPDSVELGEAWDEEARQPYPFDSEVHAVSEIPVTYTLLEDTGWGEPAGESLRFAVLVKETPDSPWRVHVMGTGP